MGKFMKLRKWFAVTLSSLKKKTSKEVIEKKNKDEKLESWLLHAKCRSIILNASLRIKPLTEIWGLVWSLINERVQEPREKDQQNLHDNV